MLTACNKDKDKNPAVTYGDIYVQHGGIVRKTDYDHDRSFALPEGLMPYYEEKVRSIRTRSTSMPTTRKTAC